MLILSMFCLVHSQNFLKLNNYSEPEQYCLKHTVPGDSNSLCEKKNSGYSFVFELSRFNRVNIICNMLPKTSSSLNNYFNDILQKKSAEEDLMRHEWGRLRSFDKNFPTSAEVSTLKLAKDGFYYLGHGLTAKCVSCGIINENWPKNETVTETHRRLSPDCKLLLGIDTLNKPIHEYPTDDTLCAAGGNHGNELKPEGYGELGACGGYDGEPISGDELFGASNNRGDAPDSITHEPFSIQETSYLPENDTPAQSKQPVVEHHHRNNTLSKQRHNDVRNDDTNRHEIPTTGTTGTTGVPKYPQYGTETARLDTFATWQYGNKAAPASLAKSGLFYTNVQDCVRCFFCGGGMRNWERDDDPWEEHARWFSNCGFVQQKKGQAFIDMVSTQFEASGHSPTHSHEFNFDNGQTRPHNNESDQRSYLQLDAPSGSKRPKDDEFIENSRSTGAKKVLEMGYSMKCIDDALLELKELRGSERFSVDAVVNFMVENNFCNRNDDNVACVLEQKVTGKEDCNNQLATLTHTLEESQNDKSSRQKEHGALSTRKQDGDENKANKLSLPSESTEKKLSNEEMSKLKEENEKFKQIMMCKICMDKDANIVFLPCGHMVACIECAHALRKCAVCRERISGTVRAFPS